MQPWDDRFYEKYGQDANLCCPHCAHGTIKIYVPPKGSPDPQVYTCQNCGFQWDDDDPLDIGTPDGYELVSSRNGPGWVELSTTR